MPGCVKAGAYAETSSVFKGTFSFSGKNASSKAENVSQETMETTPLSGGSGGGGGSIDDVEYGSASCETPRLFDGDVDIKAAVGILFGAYFRINVTVDYKGKIVSTEISTKDGDKEPFEKKIELLSWEMSTKRFHGKVTTSDGKPVSGVTVTMERAESSGESGGAGGGYVAAGGSTGAEEMEKAGSGDYWWLRSPGCDTCFAANVDFDQDGKDEMLVCRTKSEKGKESASIELSVYENEESGVVQASKMQFNPYYDGTQHDAAGDILLQKSEWQEATMMVSTVKKEGHVYIICEEQQSWGTFADGVQTDHWILEYTDGKLQYVSSLTQTEGGSSGFVYTAYFFEDGELQDQEIYSADEGESGKKGKYSKFSVAVKKYFEKYGISVNKKSFHYHGYARKQFCSVIAKGSKPVRQFTFFNKCTKRDYSKHVFRYKATSSARNNF